MRPIRFIIITVPPPEVAARIDSARRAVCKLADSHAALAYPPHVTLRTGVLVPGESVSRFIQDFKGVVGTWEPFPLSTEGFLTTSYPSDGALKWLVGYRVRKDEALVTLNRRLLSYEPYRASGRLDFQPHVTLAFDDLTKEGFSRACGYLTPRPADVPETFQWACDSVGLYSLEGDLWTPYVVFRQRGTVT